MVLPSPEKMDLYPILQLLKNGRWRTADISTFGDDGISPIPG